MKVVSKVASISDKRLRRLKKFNFSLIGMFRPWDYQFYRFTIPIGIDIALLSVYHIGIDN